MPRAAPRRVPRSSATTAPESIVQLTLGNLLAGLLVLLIVALLVYGFRRTMRPRIASPELDDPALPALHLRLRSDDSHVVPEVIRFPTAGKLRIGYHPPFMDRHVGKPDFARLEFVDVRGDGAAARDLSRHAACIEPRRVSCASAAPRMRPVNRSGWSIGMCCVCRRRSSTCSSRSSRSTTGPHPSKRRSTRSNRRRLLHPRVRSSACCARSAAPPTMTTMTSPDASD